MITIPELIKSGVHFGHPISRWNPKMSKFILSGKNKIHLIDLKETIKGIHRARKYVKQIVSQGKKLVFVGTKRQARDAVKEEALRTEQYWACERWLGGTLTNFKTVFSRLSTLDELEALFETGEIERYTKKEQIKIKREIRRITRNLEGIREMSSLPDLLVIVDPGREKNAVAEARKMNIPVVAIIDTDDDPEGIDIPIPANDDSVKSISVILNELSEAAEEGLKIWKREDIANKNPKKKNEPKIIRRGKPAEKKTDDKKADDKKKVKAEEKAEEKAEKK